MSIGPIEMQLNHGLGSLNPGCGEAMTMSKELNWIGCSKVVSGRPSSSGKVKYHTNGLRLSSTSINHPDNYYPYHRLCP